MKLVFVVVSLFAISTVVILRANALTCFSCGYKEDKDGHRTAIDEPGEDVTFCGTDKLSNSSTVPTEEAAPGGCCAAYKIEQTNEDTGELIWISRFGAGSDSDEEGFHFTCGKVNDEGYTCHAENVKIGDEDVVGNVCHCYTNKCNEEIPPLTTSTTLSTRSTSNKGGLMKSSILMNSFILMVLFFYYKL